METTILFSVHDLKVFPITALGTEATDPTYGTPVDVPGISEVGLDPSVTNAILRGDGRVIDQRSILDALTFAFTYGKLSPDVLAVIDGGTVSDNGIGGTTRYVRDADDKIPEFGVAALISEVDNPAGAAKLYVYRCKMQGGTLFASSDNAHGQPSFEVQAIGLPKGPMWAVDLEDTEAALPANSAALVATYAPLV